MRKIAIKKGSVADNLGLQTVKERLDSKSSDAFETSSESGSDLDL
jgi:hypothetical protein